MAEDQHNLDTRCIHEGEIDDPQGSPFTPTYNTTTFRYATSAEMLEVVEGRQPGGLYTRYGLNPTITSVEAKLASIEQAEAAFLFTSGMAAEAALFLTHGRRGVLCIGDAYGGTLELLGEQLPALGIKSHFLLGSELEQAEAILKQGLGLLYLETPTNPGLDIFNITAFAELAHRHGALMAVDNTFATPVNQRPLDLGADLVVQSATKYLGGHSDITAGVLAGSAALVQAVQPWRKNLGQVPAPETAALLARSLRTLPLRVERHNRNAQAVAEALLGHPRLRRVLYPGLPDFPQHALARRQMSGFGGMLSIEVEGGREAAMAFVDRLRLIANAPSLGGVESLATLPVITTHHGMTAAERQRRGIGEGMVRLSIGLEDPADLIADVQTALDS